TLPSIFCSRLGEWIVFNGLRTSRPRWAIVVGSVSLDCVTSLEPLVSQTRGDLTDIRLVSKTALVEHDDVRCQVGSGVTLVAFFKHDCSMTETASHEVDFQRMINSARFIEK